MNKLAVITGGSTGIGAHLAEAFAQAGYDIGFSFVGDPRPAEQVVEAIVRNGGRAFSQAADVGKGADVTRFYADLAAWAGRAPDVLINNAGIQTWSSLLDLSEQDWDDVIRTNLKGCFLNSKAAAQAMIDAGKPGSIINIGSGCNKLAFPKLVSYTASKGGIEQFTKVSAAELGPHGIRVNCIAPGAILNERTAAEQADYAAQWSRLTPLRRVGRAEDLSGPALFLASDAAGFVTGQTIWIDGGLFSQAPWPA